MKVSRPRGLALQRIFYHPILRDRKDALLCANDPKDILEKLLLLRDDPEQTAAIGRNAWERIQFDFDWPRNVAETINVFQRVLDTVT